jgi:serine protease Do
VKRLRWSGLAPVVVLSVLAALMMPAWAWGRGQEAATVPTPGRADGSELASESAQRIYEQARRALVRVRTLVNAQSSQSTVGSGFVVSEQGHILTNYHVVSQAALQPQRYRLSFSTTGGEEGDLDLLAFDVVHDLALVQVRQWRARAPWAGGLSFRPQGQAMMRGERMFALGNPLDVGFAVVEGNYNGWVERSFLPQIFFSGSLNPGMSGGPALDEQGRVIGVNVATSREGQQVSFVVPAEHAQALLARVLQAPKPPQPMTEAVYPEVARQLLQHQKHLTQRFKALPWRWASHARYRIPVPADEFMRCWGTASSADSKGLIFERSDCQMDSAVFVNDHILTGSLSVRHEVYDGRKLGALRFAKVYSDSFRNEQFGFSSRDLTGPRCTERYVDRDGLALRAVVCLRAYKKLVGLYDLSVLLTSVDASLEGVQGRFDAHGVSFDSALLLSEHYVQGFAWQAGVAR